MDYDEDVARFAGQQEAAAEVAFNRLCTRYYRELENALKRKFHNSLTPDEIEDAVQETFVKVWHNRQTFREGGYEGWKAFVWKTAVWKTLEKRPRGNVSLEDIVEREGTPDAARQALSTLWLEYITHGADVCWLGLAPEHSSRVHRRQTLAAQLYYLEGIPLADLPRYLPTPPRKEPPLTPAVLEAWLQDPGVLRAMAYQELHYTSLALACCLLGLEEDTDAATLNQLLNAALQQPQEETPVSGFTGAELALILWRYAHALPQRELNARYQTYLDQWRFEEAKISQLFTALAPRMPFKRQMQRLITSLTPLAPAVREEVLLQDGLWRRLAFQYWYLDSLPDADAVPQKDILERILPAAHLVGYQRLNEGLLNKWLSQKYLLKLLMEYLKGQEGKDDNE